MFAPQGICLLSTGCSQISWRYKESSQLNRTLPLCWATKNLVSCLQPSLGDICGITQVPIVWIALSLYTDKLMSIGPGNSISGSSKTWVYTVVGIKLTSAACVNACLEIIVSIVYFQAGIYSLFSRFSGHLDIADITGVIW